MPRFAQLVFWVGTALSRLGGFLQTRAQKVLFTAQYEELGKLGSNEALTVPATPSSIAAAKLKKAQANDLTD